MPPLLCRLESSQSFNDGRISKHRLDILLDVFLRDTKLTPSNSVSCRDHVDERSLVRSTISNQETGNVVRFELHTLINDDAFAVTVNQMTATDVTFFVSHHVNEILTVELAVNIAFDNDDVCTN